MVVHALVNYDIIDSSSVSDFSVPQGVLSNNKIG